MSNYDKYFDIDARADLTFSEEDYLQGEKEVAKFAYRMKADSHQILMAGIMGDPAQAATNPLVTNWCYVAPEARPALAAMQEWDIELIKDPRKTFEIRYFWNFARPTTTKANPNFWVARLDIYFSRGSERRWVALWANGVKDAAFLQALDRLPNLIVLPAESKTKEPDVEADFERITEIPNIWVGLTNDKTNMGLKLYLEKLDQHLELAQEQKLVKRHDNPNDPLSAFKRRGKGNK